MEKNFNIKAAKSIQAAIPELGKAEKITYIMRLTAENGDTIDMNVGLATYNWVTENSKKVEEVPQKVTNLGKIK